MTIQLRKSIPYDNPFNGSCEHHHTFTCADEMDKLIFEEAVAARCGSARAFRFGDTSFGRIISVAAVLCLHSDSMYQYVVRTTPPGVLS